MRTHRVFVLALALPACAAAEPVPTVDVPRAGPSAVAPQSPPPQAPLPRSPPEPRPKGGPAPVDPDGLVGAKHILCQFAGSMRASPQITRSRDDAHRLAAAVRDRARRGEDFASLAAYSDEPGAAKRGGDLGRFRPEVMVPEFRAALLELGVGEISDVVESRFGFHVILRTK
jgi:hypothetical protein